MKPMQIEGQTRVLAEDQDEYLNLPIRDVQEDNGNVMYSAWQPTEEELATLNAGGAVVLGICGVVHPPVVVMTCPVSGGEAE